MICFISDVQCLHHPNWCRVPKTSLVKNGCTGHVLIYIEIDRLTCSPMSIALGRQIPILYPTGYYIDIGTQGGLSIDNIIKNSDMGQLTADPKKSPSSKSPAIPSTQGCHLKPLHKWPQTVGSLDVAWHGMVFCRTFLGEKLMFVLILLWISFKTLPGSSKCSLIFHWFQLHELWYWDVHWKPGSFRIGASTVSST